MAILQGFGAAVAALGMLGATAPAAHVPVAAAGWTASVLHDFGRTAGDASGPVSSRLVGDREGNLYGTTAYGGSRGEGAVFRLSPLSPALDRWRETVLFSFSGGVDGAFPLAGVIDYGGALYGTTVGGGASATNCACGTIFKLAPPEAGKAAWTESVLYAFGGTDGAEPEAGLYRAPSGAFFGTTLLGGDLTGCAYGCGTVFELRPPAAGREHWSESVLHRFAKSNDGYEPQAGLIAALRGGALYGTTSASRLPGATFGTVFELAPVRGTDRWAETVLHAFAGPDGGTPSAGLVQDAKGQLFGTTLGNGFARGYGNVFELTPPTAGKVRWSETVLHAFSGVPDGASSAAGLIQDAAGALYGTTTGGGTGGLGTAFKLAPVAGSRPAWVETVLHSFTGADGQYPASDLVAHFGALYGMTQEGGLFGCGFPGGCGTSFKLQY